jgi:hypothetical protein
MSFILLSPSKYVNIIRIRIIIVFVVIVKRGTQRAIELPDGFAVRFFRQLHDAKKTRCLPLVVWKCHRAPADQEYCAIISDEEQWPLLPSKVSSSPAAPEQPMVVVLSFRKYEQLFYLKNIEQFFGDDPDTMVTLAPPTAAMVNW